VIGVLSGEELVAILGAFTALVLGLFGLLLKFLIDTRNETRSVNRAVNNRPSDQPTAYERLERIDGRLDRLDKKVDRQDVTQTARHHENVGRIREFRESVTEDFARVEERVAALEHKGEP
jgi:hypothetical protein